MTYPKLTDAKVRDLPHDAQRREHPDSEMPGLVLITAALPSTHKSWSYRYRIGRRSKRLTLGAFPALTVREARAAAQLAKAELVRGSDPIQRKRERAATENAKGVVANPISTVIDRFLRRQRSRVTEGWLSETAKLLEAAADRWGSSRDISTVTQADVEAVVFEVLDRGHGRSANKALAILRVFFNWAAKRGYVIKSPAAGVEAPHREISRDRVLSLDEIKWLMNAAGQLGVYGSIVHALMYTGQRRSEVGNMQWPEIDFTRRLWLIPKERAKNGRANEVPLSPQMIQLLQSQTRHPGCSLVFTNDGQSPVGDFSGYKTQLDAKMLALARSEAEQRGDDPADVSLPPFRLHDIRRTCASLLPEVGASVESIERLLNHSDGQSVGGMKAVYIRNTYRRAKRRALTELANVIDQIAAGDLSAFIDDDDSDFGPNVVTISKQRGKRRAASR
jgi:integrase